MTIEIISKFRNFSIHQIPWEANKGANKLAKGITGISNDKCMDNPSPDINLVATLKKILKNWMEPIIWCLKKGLLLNKPIEA